MIRIEKIKSIKEAIFLPPFVLIPRLGSGVNAALSPHSVRPESLDKTRE